MVGIAYQLWPKLNFTKENPFTVLSVRFVIIFAFFSKVYFNKKSLKVW